MLSDAALTEPPSALVGQAACNPCNQSPLEKATAPWLEAGMKWVSSQVNYSARGAEPLVRRQDYSWGPGRSLLVANIYDVTASGERLPVVQLFYLWDSKEQSIKAFGIEPSGLYLDGYITHEGQDSWQYIFTGASPSGKTFVSMEETRHENGKMIVVGYLSDGHGGWTSPSEESVWLPVATDGSP